LTVAVHSHTHHWSYCNTYGTHNKPYLTL